MKRAIGLIAATLLTASVYSQDYSSSSSTSNPDSTPDYQSRQSEAGAPATNESSAGYDRAPGLSGGNSSTGQSNGANVGSAPEQDQSLTTRDSDVSGNKYKGSVQSESELNSERSEPLRGSGTADGAFHDPAAPAREGAQSEGWSSSGTFSGAGPGSVSGSASSSELNSSATIPAPTESSSNFSADVSNNSALENRDQDLSNRGLEPDSDQLSRTDAFSNRVEGDMNNDDTLIFEDWTIVVPNSELNVGAPAESEFGVGSSSDLENRDQFDSSASGSIRGDSYSNDLYQRVQRGWSGRSATDLMDRSLEELSDTRYKSDATQSDVGAPGSSVSGSGKSEDSECDTHKGSAADYEQGGNQSSEKYHINRGDDEKYHINREGSGDRSNSDTRAPGEYGDRPDRSDSDDGHLNGNNAAGSSGSSERSSDESSKSTNGALTQPDL
jgi:hypothetical protein